MQFPGSARLKCQRSDVALSAQYSGVRNSFLLGKCKGNSGCAEMERGHMDWTDTICIERIYHTHTQKHTVTKQNWNKN